MTKRAALVLAVALVGPATLQAQESRRANRGTPATVVSERRPYRLDYDLVEQTLTVTNHFGKTVSSWTDQHPDSPVQPVIAVPPERPVVVTVRNGNPLLYSYDVEFQHLQAVADRSCSSISRRFSTQFAFGSLLPMVAGQEEALDEYGEAIPDTFFDRMSDLFNRREGELSASAITAEVDDLRRVMARELADYRDGIQDVENEASRIKESIPSLAWRSESEALTELVDSLIASVRSNLGIGPGVPKTAPALVERLQRLRGEAIENSFIPRVLELSDAAGKTSGVSAGAADLLAGWVAEIEAGNGSWQVAIGRLFGELQMLQRLSARSTQVFLVPAARADGVGRSQAISINVLSDSSQVRLNGAPRYKAGRVVFYTRPGSALSCSISLGAVFSSVAPDYEVGSDGVVVDQNTFGDGAATSAAAFVHIAPSRFDVVSLSIGLGVGGRLPDLYLGGSLGLLRPLVVTTGYRWRWQQTLPDGLRSGDMVSDPELLERIVASRLTRRYVSGLFIGISLGL